MTVRVAGDQSDPIVIQPFFKRAQFGDGFIHNVAALFDDYQQARGLMHFYHLLRQSGAQIAFDAVGDAEQADHVMRQLGACAVNLIVDAREQIFQINAAANRNHGG